MLRPFHLTPWLTLLAAGPVFATQTVCHYDYGGESKVLTAKPVSSPYEVPVVQVGSYFQLRVVLQLQPRDQASIKIYVYADTDDGAAPLHQATYPYPPPQARGRYGFTGLHFVYEPKRDGELQYWCEVRP